MESKIENNSPAIWQKIQDRMKSVPLDELAQIPPDAAAQHDHYLYGSAKKPSSTTKRKVVSPARASQKKKLRKVL